MSQNLQLAKRLTVLVLLPLASLSVIPPRITQGQVTRNWINPDGGQYGFFRQWAPSGAPLAEDTARFNVLTPDEVPILLLEDAAATELLIRDGDIVFGGAGVNGPREYDLGTASIERKGELTVRHRFADINVNISDEFTVHGDLSVLGGARLTSGESVFDSPIAEDIATVTLSGANPDGDPSYLEASRLLIGHLNHTTIRVDDGAKMQIGSFRSGRGLELRNGEIVISGATPGGSPSTFTSRQRTEFGNQGVGSVQVLAGAQLSTLRGTSLGLFDNEAFGSVLVDGHDASGNPSRWDSLPGIFIDRGNITVSGGGTT